MNDDSVTRYPGSPTSMKCAYILFYMRERGQALQAAVTSGSECPPVTLNGIKSKNRKVSDTESDADEKQKPPFIGPLLPPAISETMHSATPSRDPQADLLKRKIEAVSKPTPSKPSNALLSLSQYVDEDDEDEDVGEKVEAPASSPASKETHPTPPVSSTTSTSTIPSIPPSQFYGSSPSTQGTKRKLQDHDDETSQRSSIRRFSTHSSATKHRVFGLVSPFARTSSVKNSMQGRQGRFGNKKKHII
jgi:ubiquitin carboxyl-terminal hydrolase 36/42